MIGTAINPMVRAPVVVFLVAIMGAAEIPVIGGSVEASLVAIVGAAINPVVRASVVVFLVAIMGAAEIPVVSDSPVMGSSLIPAEMGTL